MPHQVVYVRGAESSEEGREEGREGVTYLFGSAMVRCLQVVMVIPPSLALLSPLVMLK